MNGIKHKCSNCGSSMAFDAKTQFYKCESCGTEEQIEIKQTAMEHSYIHNEFKGMNVEEIESTMLECDSCGATLVLEASVTATSCPYCGKNVVLHEKQMSIIKPDGLIPFKITHREAEEKVMHWIKKVKFAPNALKNLYQKSKMIGIYTPFWTFDVQAEVNYTAEGGKDYTKTVKDSEGKDKQVSETIWSKVRGSVSKFFDDVLICASTTITKAFLTSGLGKFSTDKLIDYDERFISGYGAEIIGINIEEAHEKALEIIRSKMNTEARNEILKDYDRVQNLKCNYMFSAETYKLALLPIYSMAYSFNGKVYQVIINGETGEVSGESPVSKVKVALTIAAIVLALVALYYFVIKK